LLQVERTPLQEREPSFGTTTAAEIVRQTLHTTEVIGPVGEGGDVNVDIPNSNDPCTSRADHSSDVVYSIDLTACTGDWSLYVVV
jgi:hypothetical protein